MQITCKHLTIYMFITNTLTGSLQYDLSVLIPGQEFVKELGTYFFQAISFSTPCKGCIVKKLKYCALAQRTGSDSNGMQ